jgi:hypothetical protein
MKATESYMQQHNVFCKQFRKAVQQMQLDYPEGDIPEFMYIQGSNGRDRTNNSLPDGGEFGLATVQFSLSQKIMFVFSTIGNGLKPVNITQPFLFLH